MFSYLKHSSGLLYMFISDKVDFNSNTMRTKLSLMATDSDLVAVRDKDEMGKIPATKTR